MFHIFFLDAEKLDVYRPHPDPNTDSPGYNHRSGAKQVVCGQCQSDWESVSVIIKENESHMYRMRH